MACGHNHDLEIAATCWTAQRGVAGGPLKGIGNKPGLDALSTCSYHRQTKHYRYSTLY